MKNKLPFLMIIAVMLFHQSLMAQLYVSTVPENKNAILDVFTGVQCPNCPSGHTVLSGILTSNPGDAYAVCFHPTNSSYTTPYSGSIDLRRIFPDGLYTTAFAGSRFMPGSFINRRLWANNERMQSRTLWASYATTIMGESSPLNVGMASTYDDNTKVLSVTVEVYFTSTVTDQHNLNVYLSENNLIAQQSNGGTNYVHYHVFREAFTTQWGDPITEATTQGSLVTKTFTFDNSTQNYDMTNCELLAYVTNDVDKEVISGIGAAVNSTTVGLPDVVAAQDHMVVYPNPVNETAKIEFNLKNSGKVSLSITDLTGREIYRATRSFSAGDQEIWLNRSELNLVTGIYLVNIKADNLSATAKMVVR